MSIGQVASSIWSAATTALTSPNAATTPVSQPSTQSNGSSAANGTTGSSNPFQALSPDMQSWLNQNQSIGAAHMHHRHHGGGTDQAAQSYAASHALSAAPETQPAMAL